MTTQSSIVRFRKGDDSWDVPATVSILDRLIEAAAALGVTVEEPPEFMEEQMDLTVTKALSAMDVRITAILKSGGARSREGAIAEVASSSDPADRALWSAYKQVAVRYAAAPEPQPFAKSEAFLKLERKARKLAKRTGMSDVSAFAAVYTNPRYAGLVEAEKAAHFARSETIVKVAPQPFLNAFQILQREREQHLVKAMAASTRPDRRT